MGAARVFGFSDVSDGDGSRLFGTRDGGNAWGSNSVTPQEWAVEARRVLAWNGYAMGDEKKPEPFPAFMAKLTETPCIDAQTERDDQLAVECLAAQQASR